MKLSGVGALLMRLTAAVFVLRGVTALLNVAWVYARVYRAVEANAALKQGLHESVKNGVLSAVIAIGCGVGCWLFSQALGKLLANGLEEPATPAG